MGRRRGRGAGESGGADGMRRLGVKGDRSSLGFRTRRSPVMVL